MRSVDSLMPQMARAVHCVVVWLLGVALAACGASSPPQPGVAEPVVVAPAAEAARAQEIQGNDRRGDGRRDRRANERAAQVAAVQVEEPVPEAVLQAYARALAAMRSENWIEAKLELEQLVLEHPGYPGPHVNLAIVYMHEERNKDARAILDQALAIDPGHSAANNQLGILLRSAGEFDEAEAAYRRAIETAPSHALAHYNLAVLLDLYLRRQAEALEHYEFYQSSLAEPDEAVGRWIIDLRRRLGVSDDASRVAQEDGA
ncbi:MAG TPA: tetratricopeptide repeat protein [Gammaproteobacteria bacterium]|nr:tetratricopeptide repeat protein [Gammaproteobacteria bacterium]